MKNFKKKYRTKVILFFFIFILLFFGCNSIYRNNKRDNHVRAKGIIQEDIYAVKLGKIILESVYGEAYIKKFTPFRAKLINDSIWHISGDMKYDVGGVPYIEFKSTNCEVIKFGKSK